MVRLRLKTLCSSVLGATMMVVLPSSASEVEHRIGLQLGAAKPTATSEWSVDPLTTGVESDYAFQPGLILMATYNSEGSQVWRFSGGLSRGQWNNACILELALGVDYVFPVGVWQAYMGPRVGLLHFTNDHTNSSTQSYLAGVQLGVLIPASALPRGLGAIGSPELELYARSIRTDATASRQVGGQTHQVSLERVDALGMSLNWRF